MTRRHLLLGSMALNAVGMVASIYAGSVGWFAYNALWFAVTGLLLPAPPASAESLRS